MLGMDTLAKRVKFARERLQMNQETLAKLSGLKQPDISKIERGKILRTTGLIGLAVALQVRPEWLDTGDGGMIPDGPIQRQADPPAEVAGEASATAMEIALLYDLIPVSDRVRRTRAYNAATAAILAVLEERPATE